MKNETKRKRREIFWETLGLLLSDGHISNNSISLTQCESHYNILDLFEKNLKKLEKGIEIKKYLHQKAGKRKILGKICNVQNASSLGIYRTKIAQKWKSYKDDFLNEKTYPKNKGEKTAFIRGYYYGDGTLYVRPNIQGDHINGTTAEKVSFSDSNSIILKKVIQIMYDLGFPYPVIYTCKKENCKRIYYNTCYLEFVSMIKPLLKLNEKHFKLFFENEEEINEFQRGNISIDMALEKRRTNSQKREDFIYKKPEFTPFSIAEKLMLK